MSNGWFSEIITTEEQYEVAKARATMSFLIEFGTGVIGALIDKHFPSHSTKVR